VTGKIYQRIGSSVILSAAKNLAVDVFIDTARSFVTMTTVDVILSKAKDLVADVCRHGKILRFAQDDTRKDARRMTPAKGSG